MTVKRANISKSKIALREAASSNDKRLHIVPSKGGWTLKKEGSKRSSGSYTTKDKAIREARKIKQFDGPIVIHKKDGSIEKSNYN